MKIVLGIAVALMLVGCGAKTISISKCKTYENDICVNSETRKVTLCENPQVIDGKTYCD